MVMATTRLGAQPPGPETDIAVIVHASAPATRLGRNELASVFTVSRRTWGDGTTILAFNSPPDSPLRQAFDRATLGMDTDQVSRFWIDQRIRGGTRPPKHVADPNLVVKLCSRLSGAIGYVPATLVGRDSREVRIVARVRNGTVIAP